MYEYRAQIVRVVDGDTLILDVDLGMRTWIRGKPFRLARINAPERRDPAGPAATAALAAAIGPLPASAIITTTKDRRDPYDRYIVEVLVGGVNLSDWMVSNGHAVLYP